MLPERSGRGGLSTQTKTCVIFFFLLLLVGAEEVEEGNVVAADRMWSLSVVLNPLLFLLLFGYCPTVVSFQHNCLSYFYQEQHNKLGHELVLSCNAEFK